jgi:hypothetical protein
LSHHPQPSNPSAILPVTAYVSPKPKVHLPCPLPLRPHRPPEMLSRGQHPLYAISSTPAILKPRKAVISSAKLLFPSDPGRNTAGVHLRYPPPETCASHLISHSNLRQQEAGVGAPQPHWRFGTRPSTGTESSDEQGCVQCTEPGSSHRAPGN